MKLETISSFADLAKYGIEPLTGEACRLGTRILCDLTPQGADYVRQVIGMKDTSGFCDAVNGRDGAKFSCLIGRHVLVDLAILIAWYRFDYVILTDNDTVFGLRGGHVRTDYDAESGQSIAEYRPNDSDDWRPWPACYGAINRVWRNDNNGLRNMHQMSGEYLTG